MTRAPAVSDKPVPGDADATQRLQTALQLVVTAVQQMDMRQVDENIAGQLTALAKTCANIATQLLAPAPIPDRATFDHLLALAGADTARDLLDRLVEDLTAVCMLLDIGGLAPDWDMLRRQSHVLIGLAGAVGADALYQQAVALSELSKTEYQQGLDPVLARLIPSLTALIVFVQAERNLARAAQS